MAAHLPPQPSLLRPTSQEVLQILHHRRGITHHRHLKGRIRFHPVAHRLGSGFRRTPRLERLNRLSLQVDAHDGGWNHRLCIEKRRDSCDAAIPGSEKVRISEEPSCRTSVSFQSAHRPRMKKSFPIAPGTALGSSKKIVVCWLRAKVLARSVVISRSALYLRRPLKIIPPTSLAAESACWIGLSMDGSAMEPIVISFFLSELSLVSLKNATAMATINNAGRP